MQIYNFNANSMTYDKKGVINLFHKFEDNIIDIRNHLHTYPELSFQEFKTSAFITEKLEEIDISFKKGIVKTGILGKIEGKNPNKKVIALRADIDALPIQENKKHKICSANDGVMHACGHDIHTTSLIGAARILNNLKDKFEGTILLVFQPGEEKMPGGAKLMLEEGIFSTIKPDWIIGLHVDTELKTGTIGIREGLYMASCDEIYLTLKGTGGHAGAPHKINDTILAASSIIVNLQQVISRRRPPIVPSVLSFGKIIANGAINVIPDEVKIHGTFRALDEEWRKNAHQIIKDVIKHTASAFGVSCEIDFKYGYPSLSNDVKHTRYAEKILKQLWGKDNLKHVDIRLGGEDFSFYSQLFPATFFRIGVCPQDLDFMKYGLHSPNFYPDEKAIKIGAVSLAWLALSFLNGEKI